MRFDLTTYRSLRDQDPQGLRALARTRIACACLEHGAPPDDHARRAAVRTIVVNHAMQAQHLDTGLDEVALVVGDMYGYGYALRSVDDDLADASRATITQGSVRVDRWGTDGAEESFGTMVELARGRALLPTVLQAAAYMTQWAGATPTPTSAEHLAARERHLTVRQVLTLWTALRRIGDGVVPVADGPHACAGQRRAKDLLWLCCADVSVHKWTGELARAGRRVRFEAWCDGSVERGLATLLENV